MKKASAPAAKKSATAAAKKAVAPAAKKPASSATEKPAPARAASHNDERIHTFTLNAPHAHWASVVGSFNNWNIEDGAMKREKGSGPWTRAIKLKPGKHEYKFVVDGEWWADPDNPSFVYNQHGTTNNVLKI